MINDGDGVDLFVFMEPACSCGYIPEVVALASTPKRPTVIFKKLLVLLNYGLWLNSAFHYG